MDNFPLAVPQMSVSEIKNLAEQFVVQYYSIMNENPSNLHRFYIDKSSMVYDDLPSFGQQKIHEKFMQMDLKNTKVAVLQLDALLAHLNSVIIQVAGEISKGNAEPRRFMQSFVLVEQSPNSLYVLNDIFRYQDKVFQDEIVTAKHSNPNKENIAAPIPVAVVQKHELQERNSFGGEENFAHPVKASKPVFEKEIVHQKSKKPEPKAEVEAQKKEPVVPAPPATNNNTKTSESENKSWAQMASEGKIPPKAFQRNNNQPAPTPAAVAPETKKSGLRGEGKQLSFNTAKNNEDGPKRSQGNYSRGGGNPSRGGRGVGSFMRRNGPPPAQQQQQKAAGNN